MPRDARLPVVRRLVVKVGASVLADDAGHLSSSRIAHIAQQIAECVARRREVVLVSSGAIACGMAKLRLRRRPTALAQLQACAAIGQSELMRLYAHAFGEHGLLVGQVLLTQADLTHARRCRNAKNTLTTLLARGVVPIINENDAVAVEEIAVGDNDRLSALVACLLHAQLLVILSDVDGLLERGKPIARIDTLTQAHHALAAGAGKETTTGGMASKLAAARIVRHSGIPLVIANGTTRGVLLEIVEGKPVGTLIAPPARTLHFRKLWIAFASRAPAGRVIVDQGAVEALAHQGRSLLARGIRGVEGPFQAGDSITILDAQRRELARGLVNFSSGEVARVRGLDSGQLAHALGRACRREIVHRDNLVVMRELQ